MTNFKSKFLAPIFKLVLLAVIAISSWSCEPDSIPFGYSWAIYSVHSDNLQDINTIETYFNEKGLKNGYNFTISGPTEADTDDIAISNYSELIKTIDANELSSKLSANTTFCFNLVKAGAKEDEYLATYCYPTK